MSDTREKIVENARRHFDDKQAFRETWDPTAANAARRERGVSLSPQGIAASRSRPGCGRLSIVVVCRWYGAAFCPLLGARRRRYCSRRCAGKAARARPA